MTRTILLVACAAMALAAGPAAVRGAATGPGDSARSTGCQEQIEESAEQTPRGPWRERLGDWLRRQRQRDSVDRGGYYLRSPLLHAFGPETPEDCAPEEERVTAQRNATAAHAPEDAAPTGVPDDAGQRTPDRCAALVVGTRTDSELSMELPLPQLGARDGKALGVAVLQALARGEAVLVFDNEGRPLTLRPALTRTVAIERCG